LGGRSGSLVETATDFADEHGSYNDLAGLNKLQRFNHSTADQIEHGIYSLLRIAEGATVRVVIDAAKRSR
jgi:hypothetical protein